MAPWKIGVHEIKLADWSARFTDQGFARPLGVTAEGFGLTAALTGEVGAAAAIDAARSTPRWARSVCCRARNRWRNCSAPHWSTPS